MTEIKFRARGKNSNEYLNEGKGLTLKQIQNIYEIELWDFEQFTGIRDKNGKEIYEGDIVAIKYTNYSGAAQYSSKLVEGYSFVRNFVCEYTDGEFILTDSLNSLRLSNLTQYEPKYKTVCVSRTFSRSSDRFGHYQKTEFEPFSRVGNIHENPELLEVK